MKKVLYILGSIFFALIALAFILPFFIDLNDYKAEISAKVKDYTGRDLVIQGAIQLSFLPTPSVSIQKISLSNLPGTSHKNMAEVEKLSVSAEFLPLLNKKVHITNVELINPHIHLEKLSSEPNWVLSSPQTQQDTSPAAATPSAAGTPFQLKFKDVQVVGGYIEYKEGKSVQKIEGLNASLKAKSLDGPFEAKGTARALEKDVTFDLSLGGIKGEQALKGMLEVAGSRLHFEGQTNLEALTYKGSARGEGNVRKLLDAFAIKSTLPAFLGGTVSFEGDVVCGETKVSLTPLIVSLNGVQTKGSLSFSLKPTLKIDGSLSQLPGGTAVTFSVGKRDALFGGPLTLSIRDPKAFFAWVEMGTDKLPPQALKPLHFEGNVGVLEKKIQVSDMSLKVGDVALTGGIGLPLGEGAKIFVDLKTPEVGAFLPLIAPTLTSVKGPAYLRGIFAGDLKELSFEDASLGIRSLQLKASGKVSNFLLAPTFRGTFALSGSSLSEALKLAGISSEGRYGAYTFSGSVGGDLKSLTVDTKGTLDTLQLSMKGSLSNITSNLGLNISLALTHPNLKTFLGNLGISNVVSSGNMNLSTTLTGQARAYKFSDLKGSFGPSFSLTGSGDVNLSAHRPKVQAQLNLSDINLDSLFAMMAHYEGLKKSVEPRLILVSRRSPDPSSKSGHWSAEPLKLEFLKSFDGEIFIATPSIKRKDLVINQVQARARLHEGILEIPQLMGNIFGGKLLSSLRLESGRNDLTLMAGLEGANLRNLLATGPKIKIVDGILNVSVSLKSQGASVAQMISRLNGQVSLDAKDGVIHGFDLQALSRQVDAIKDIGSFAGLFMTYMAGGSTPFKTYNAVINFQNGIGKIDQMTLSAQGGEGTANGTIDLPNYALDILGQFRLIDHPKFPPFKMRLSGPLDNPKRDFDTSNLQQYMLDNVLKGVVSKVLSGKTEKPADLVGSLLGGIVGGQKEEAPATPPQEPQKPAETAPEKIIEDLAGELLGGLFKEERKNR